MTRVLGVDARRGVKQSGAALDVLRGAGTAAALVEVGFLDHPEEGSRLGSASGREPIARALVAAIRDYAQHDDPGPDEGVRASKPRAQRRDGAVGQGRPNRAVAQTPNPLKTSTVNRHLKPFGAKLPRRG
jgi:hypothetical protein